MFFGSCSGLGRSPTSRSSVTSPPSKCKGFGRHHDQLDERPWPWPASAATAWVSECCRCPSRPANSTRPWALPPPHPPGSRDRERERREQGGPRETAQADHGRTAGPASPQKPQGEHLVEGLQGRGACGAPSPIPNAPPLGWAVHSLVLVSFMVKVFVSFSAKMKAEMCPSPTPQPPSTDGLGWGGRVPSQAPLPRPPQLPG